MLEDTTANPAAGLVMPHPAGGSTGGYGIPSAGRAPLPSASECPFGTATAACRGWPSWFSLEAAADELRSVETIRVSTRIIVAHLSHRRRRVGVAVGLQAETHLRHHPLWQHAAPPLCHGAQ